jgi:hypothetical protein
MYPPEAAILGAWIPGVLTYEKTQFLFSSIPEALSK